MTLWILTGLSIIGVILNIKKRRECFICWMVSNGCWAVVDFYHGIYAQSVLFAIYFCLAIYGIKEWKK